MPYEERMDVLYLGVGVATSAVRDHSTYAQALERLMGVPAWRASAARPAAAAAAPPPPPPPPGTAVPTVVLGVPVHGVTSAPMGLPVRWPTLGLTLTLTLTATYYLPTTNT